VLLKTFRQVKYKISSNEIVLRSKNILGKNFGHRLGTSERDGQKAIKERRKID
jgi:hypothetical protein